MKTVLIEAIVVGVVLVIVGNIVGYIIGKTGYLSPPLPKICDTWNRYHVMEISLFLTGFLSHLLFEFLGANRWYCRHGYACKRK